MTKYANKSLELLFQKLDNQIKNYPSTTVKIPTILPGLRFFPGGNGCWIDNDSDTPERFPHDGIMVLGQDFDSEESYNATLKSNKSHRKGSTWRGTKEILEKANVNLKDCFFTNAILGLRKGSITTGKSLAFNNEDFLNECRKFFIYQIYIQQPKVILLLGKYNPEFLYPLSTDLTKLKGWESEVQFKKLDLTGNQVVFHVKFNNRDFYYDDESFQEMKDYEVNIAVLVHPSFGHLNRPARVYKSFKGEKAEIQMIKDAIIDNWNNYTYAVDPGKCWSCAHLELEKSDYSCKAFDKIPERILAGNIEHNEIIPGQNGDFIYTTVDPGTYSDWR